MYKSMHSREKKNTLLKKVAYLLREFENVEGYGCTNDCVAEIWLDDGAEKYLWNGGEFIKTLSSTVD